MNLVIDYGNTRVKLGVFNATELLNTYSFIKESELFSFLASQEFDHVILSSVSKSAIELTTHIKSRNRVLELNQQLPLPIHVKYATPTTLGVDRIAAACGAIEVMPDQDCLVIDMGTCINYEFVDACRNYHGGAISPGVSMRFNAMHTFTARLPLVAAKGGVPLVGASTEECMQSGVMNGVRAEIDGIIDNYKKKYPNMGVILCGGDAFFFENNLKHPIFVAPNLVLSGLNRILLHNVSF